MAEASPLTRQYQAQIVQLRALTYRDIARLWVMLDPHDLDRTYPAFAAAALSVVKTRRGVAVSLAEGYYRGLRTQSGVLTPLPVVSASPLGDTPVLQSLHFNAVVATKIGVSKGRKHEDIMGASLVRTMGAADKYINDGGREWIRLATDRDPAALGWRRVTLGTCDFCKRMADDPKIKSGAQSFPRHDHCGCQPQPEFADPAAPPVEDYKTPGANRRIETGQTRAPFELPVEDYKTPGALDRINKGITRPKPRAGDSMYRYPADAGARTTLAPGVPAAPVAASTAPAATTQTAVRLAAAHADDAPEYLKALPLMERRIDRDDFPSDDAYLRALVDDANPEFKTNKKATVNCQKVGLVMEMRRRGYDVIPGFGTPNLNFAKMFRQKNNRYAVAKPGKTQAELLDRLKDDPPGSRYIVEGFWKTGGWGHVWNAEKMKDGTLRFFDGQDGNINAAHYWREIDARGVLATRVDNTVPSESVLRQMKTREPK